MLRERQGFSFSGLPAIVALVAVAGGAVYFIIDAAITAEKFGTKLNPAFIVMGTVLIAVAMFFLRGIFTVSPNEAVVFQLFGEYAGTERRQGLRFTNPFYSRSRVSVRIRNFASEHIKVNDLDGNPIEIAAVVVWRVGDTAEASFNVDNYSNFVHVQSEAALRNLATQVAYDSHDDGQVSLRSHTGEIAERLKVEVQARLEKAGVEVLETRIAHLAYAPEIAQAMLQRQQASAIVAARQRIVDGAVGMVELALHRLAEKGTIKLDEERKAAMVSNLLVVLCGERATQPVINTGTLYTG